MIKLWLYSPQGALEPASVPARVHSTIITITTQ